MHSIQGLNSLIIEDIGKINFPEEINSISKKIDWYNQFWFVSGLPLENCKYSFSNDLLYLEEDQDGNCLIKKSDFTGEIFFSTTIINPNSKGDNYILGFKGVVFKGLLAENELLKFHVQTSEIFEEEFKKYKDNLNKTIKILNSKWYKYLYVPYFYVAKKIFSALIWGLNKLIDFLYFLFAKITFTKV